MTITAQPPISFVTHITPIQLDGNSIKPYSYVYKLRRVHPRLPVTPRSFK